jgi:hypothetical protein
VRVLSALIDTGAADAQDRGRARRDAAAQGAPVPGELLPQRLGRARPRQRRLPPRPAGRTDWPGRTAPSERRAGCLTTLGELRDELGFTVGLAVWGAAGPTFVRFEETNDALIISGRPGSVMPVLTSSTGRVFGAYLPRSITGPSSSASYQAWRIRAAHPTGDRKDEPEGR